MVDDDGGGLVALVVELDGDAVERIEAGGAPLEEAVRLGDLTRAGWETAGWARDGEGASLTLARTFADVGELRARLHDLDGGAFVREVRLARERGTFRSRDEASLSVDLRRVGSGVRADEELASRLAAAGVDVDALDAQLGADVRDAFTLDVTLTVPGGRPVTARLVPGERQTLAASRSQLDGGRVALAAAGGAFAAVALVLLAVAAAGARRARSRGRA